MSKRVAVIGAGSAGLAAAEVLSAGGCAVTVCDRMPSVGRKFLMAGRGMWVRLVLTSLLAIFGAAIFVTFSRGGLAALAVVALVGAALFLKSFQAARAIDPGFSPDGVALAQFDFSTAGYDAQQTDTFCRRLRAEMERQPGVTAVSYDDSVPLGFSGGNWETLEVEGYVPKPNENMKIYRDLVSPGFFTSMRIPLMEGRDFDWRDDRASLKVMIVNQEFVRRFLANRSRSMPRA